MSVYRMAPKPGEHPRNWKIEKFAEIGWDERFVRDMCELRRILYATTIPDPQREAVNDAIMIVLTDGLMPAFSELEKIRASEGKAMPVMDRRELYHDFCRKLWKSYKDLTQRAATAAGFNIGFLFTSEKEFAKGVAAFPANYPGVRPELGKSLEDARNRWQNDLAKFRNTFLEHQDSGSQQFKKFYELPYIESLFEEVWNTIVDLLAVLLESRFPFGTKLALPDLNKNPQLQQRFVFDVPAFRGVK
jgi:hypothetical protein